MVSYRGLDTVPCLEGPCYAHLHADSSPHQHRSWQHLCFLALRIELSPSPGWHASPHLLQGCRTPEEPKHLPPIFWNAHSHKMVSAEALKVGPVSSGCPHCSNLLRLSLA